MRRALSSVLRPAAALCAKRFETIFPLTHLSEEEKAVQLNVREWARKSVAPRSHHMDEAGKLDADLIRECFDQGYMGIEIPPELGGSGFSFFSSILAIEEIARVDPAVAVFIDVQNTLVNNIFFNFANDDQRKRYLPKLASKSVGCFCLTETTSGSDAFSLKCRAQKKGDKFILNGSKMFITNGLEAGIFLVMATTDPKLGYKGISCYIVDSSESAGVSVGKKENKLGIRASSTTELFFDNVEVPEKNLVGEPGKGYKVAMEILNEGRIGIGAQMVGIAQGSLDCAMPYIFERKQFGQYVGDFQGMQFQYAQCSVEVQAARLLTYNAARKKLNKENFVEDAAMAKLYGATIAERVASLAVEWMGGVGYSKEFPAERFYRDAKIGSIYEGTSNMQRQVLAKFLRDRYAQKK